MKLSDIVPRARDRRIVALAIRALKDGVPYSRLAERIGPQMGWMRWTAKVSDDEATRRMEAKLEQANIVAGIRAVMREGGLNLEDVVKAHKAALQDEDGNVRMRAISEYYKYAMPKPVKQVAVDQKTLIARIDVKDAAPPIQARVLDALETDG